MASSTHQVDDKALLLAKTKSRISHEQHARRTFSWTTFRDTLPDIVVAVASTYFLTFAYLAFIHDGEPVTDTYPSTLLQASIYGPTLFPIVFAAVVAKTLKSVAALRLERGTTVMTIEQLLESRSVFSALAAPWLLWTFNFLTPCLILLWLLSPLGGQASLRTVSITTEDSISEQTVTYLAFMSQTNIAGGGSAAVRLLGPANAIFTAMLTSSNETKLAARDTYGNVKIPLVESLANNNTDYWAWRPVPQKDSDVTWSALSGIPTHGIPEASTTDFTLNTAYMVASCSVEGLSTDCTSRYCVQQMVIGGGYGAHSGANYALIIRDSMPNFVLHFFSVVNDGTYSGPSNDTLTSATCGVRMSYAEVQISCPDRRCRAVAARPSLSPLLHLSNSSGNFTVDAWDGNRTVFNRLGGNRGTGSEFWGGFVNATNPSLACGTTFCPTSAIEGFLADPGTPSYAQTNTTLLWQMEPGLFSQRLTCLLNTYWLNLVAAQAITGFFDPEAAPLEQQTTDVWDSFKTYNVDNTTAIVTHSTEVLRCNMAWFAIMVVTSTILLIAALTTVVLGFYRRGPDILGSFSTVLKDNPYVDVPREGSLKDGAARAQDLRGVAVRLGDVRPEEDVGYAAIVSFSGTQGVTKLKADRFDSTDMPRIISMEVDPADEVESEYRVQAGTKVKYLTIFPGTLEPDLLSFPLGSLPPLPYEDTSWNTARMFRDGQSGGIRTELSTTQLSAVANIWHNTSYDVLTIQRTKQLTGAAFAAMLPAAAQETHLSTSIARQPSSDGVEVIAKIARFEWEIPRIEQETRAYQLLHQNNITDLAPRFLGHIHEEGRVMGFLLEKLEDRRPASIDDLEKCKTVLGRFHALGLLHGDVNRYNLLLGQDDVSLIDFEHTTEDATRKDQSQELDSLRAELVEEIGRGGGFMPDEDDD